MPLTRRQFVKRSAAAATALSFPMVASSRVLGDEPAREPIVYINPKIPSIELPAYRGNRYEAVVPDTLDLAERAALGVHGLTPRSRRAADRMVGTTHCRTYPCLMLTDYGIGAVCSSRDTGT